MLETMLDDLNIMTAKGVMYSKSGGEQRKLLTLKVKGTTFSGNPIRTTFGNTMRVIFYHLFALHETGAFTIP